VRIGRRNGNFHRKRNPIPICQKKKKKKKKHYLISDRNLVVVVEAVDQQPELWHDVFVVRHAKGLIRKRKALITIKGKNLIRT
jgi:hypothetical protein